MTETQYGTGPYAIAGYKNLGSPPPDTKLHYYALKKLFPLPLEGTLDDDLTIEGTYLDIAYIQYAQTLYNEIFADTIDLLADDYARCWQLASIDLTNRQNELISKFRTLINKNSRLTVSYFEEVGASILNQTVTVTEGLSQVFRVGTSIPPATPLPHAVYDTDGSLWSWTVTTAVLTDANLQSAYELLLISKAPAFTKVVFIYT